MKLLPATLNRALGSRLFGPGVLLVLALAMYGDVLFSVHRPVLGLFGDMSMWELPWRTLAFAELARGHLPLHNPHLFSGMPFLGESQVAILYPVNWIHLLLPPDRAINVILALHTFLLGLFTYLWARHRALSRPAATLAGAVMMFGGPYFMHLVPGHASHMAAMVWAPLIFLSGDLILGQRYRAGLLLGPFSVAMQLLAGHPQYVYFTLLALFLYGALRLIRHPHRAQALAAAAGAGVAGFVLTAVQTLSILQSAGESVRSGGGLPYEFAATFSFPPENFLTFLAPQFFGNWLSVPYWGKWFLSEASVFMSVAGLALAVYGVLAAWRRARLLLVMVLLLFLLALGSYTPLFPLLYAGLPGFDRFRGDSKFVFQALLFMSLLAGIGFDALVEQGRRRLVAAVVSVAGAVLAGAAAVVISLLAEDGPGGPWGRLMWQIGGVHTFANPSVFHSPQGVAQCGAYAAGACGVAALTLGLIAVIFWRARSSRQAAGLLAVLAVVELFVNARMERPTYPYGTRPDGGVQDFLARHPGDFRYYTPVEPNNAMLCRNYGIWGYDANIPKRYAEFIALTQGLDPNNFDHLTWPSVTRFHPLCALLRWRYSFSPALDGQLRTREATNDLPHVFLAGDFQVLTGRDRIFAAMTNAAFDPARTVVLESPPTPEPRAGPAPGPARVLSQDTDSLTLEADPLQPSLLVITDSYSRFFKATPLPGSSQRHYDVLPADYTLMAIPLAAGHHRLRLEYAPSGYVVGRWISLAGWGVYLGALGATLVATRRKNADGASEGGA